MQRRCTPACKCDAVVHLISIPRAPLVRRVGNARTLAHGHICPAYQPHQARIRPPLRCVQPQRRPSSHSGLLKAPQTQPCPCPRPTPRQGWGSSLALRLRHALTALPQHRALRQTPCRSPRQREALQMSRARRRCQCWRGVLLRALPLPARMRALASPLLDMQEAKGRLQRVRRTHSRQRPSGSMSRVVRQSRHGRPPKPCRAPARVRNLAPHRARRCHRGPPRFVILLENNCASC